MNSMVTVSRFRTDIDNVLRCGVRVNILDRSTEFDETCIKSFLKISVEVDEKAIQKKPLAYITEDEVRYWFQHSLTSIFSKKIYDDYIFDFQQLCLSDQKYICLSLSLEVVEFLSFSLQGMVSLVSESLRCLNLFNGNKLMGNVSLGLASTLNMNFIPVSLFYAANGDRVEDIKETLDVIQVLSYFNETEKSVRYFEIWKPADNGINICRKSLFKTISNRVLEDTKDIYRLLNLR